MEEQCRLIAIVGGSGAGKTWLSTRLQTLLGKEATRLSQDDFYRDLSHLSPARRERVNFDHPRAIDWERLREALTGFLRGEQVLIPCYDFATHTRRKEPSWCRPKRVMLVEGLWLLRPPLLRRMFGFKIFVDCPEIMRFDRRVQRDLAERGRTRRSVEQMFYSRVRPMHERFVIPQRRWADLVLASPPTENDVMLAARRITELLESP
jgi:uridine kinase